MWKARLLYANDGGSSGVESILPEIDDLSRSAFADVQAVDEEVEYVTEGSEEAEALARSNEAEPAEFKGKSREELLAELAKTREAIAASSKASEPVSALQQTMAQMLGQMKPAEAPIQPGYAAGISQTKRISDSEFEKYINELMLENPYKAQTEMQARILEPMVQTMAVNQAQLSRELVLTNPETKKVYDKYAREVEQYVANQPVAQRLQNPRIYQTAIEAVKATHMSDFVNEEFDKKLNDALNAKLAELGIDPNGQKPMPKPGYTAPQSAQRPPQQSSGQKKMIAIPKWVELEADKRGLDKGFYYEHLKSKGLIR